MVIAISKKSNLFKNWFRNLGRNLRDEIEITCNLSEQMYTDISQNIYRFTMGHVFFHVQYNAQITGELLHSRLEWQCRSYRYCGRIVISLVLRHADALFNRAIKLFRNLFHCYWSIFGTSVLMPLVFRALPAIGTCAHLVPTYRAELRKRSTVFPFFSFAIERKRDEKRQIIPR